MKIFVLGSLNMDLVINTKKIPEKGETITGSGFIANPGGKGANQAVAASKLGADVEMIGCVGKEFGNELINSLIDNNVGTKFLVRHNEISSGIAVITVVDGDNRIILDSGANSFCNNNDVDKAFQTACKGDLLICQLEIDSLVVEYAIKKAKELGMTTILNPAPAMELHNEALKYCDYFIPNQSECLFYTNLFPDNEEKALHCARYFKELGIKNILITLGDKGSFYYSNKENFYIKSFPTDIIDTTAAGDAFIGAFAYILSLGKDVKEAMIFASAAASIAVSKKGAQISLPYKEEVLEKLKG